VLANSKGDENPKSIDWPLVVRTFETTAKRKEGDCFVWCGPKISQGYGRFNVKRRYYLAHRVAWIIKNGPIGDGLLILHKCDNPSCVKAEHLFVGTHRENMIDSGHKGRRNLQKRPWLVEGESNPAAKLTKEQIVEIRRRYAQELCPTCGGSGRPLNESRVCRTCQGSGRISQAILATEYAVRQPAISRIINYKRRAKG